MVLASPVVVARRFLFVTETEGQNAGTWVSFFQRFTGNRSGDPWCASFVSVVLDIVYRGPAPLKRTASCDRMLAEAIVKGLVVQAAEVGDLFFYIRPGTQTRLGDAYHVGIVTGGEQKRPAGATEASVTFTGIAGNTSKDGSSPNGNGVFEHVITVGRGRVVFVRLPR